MHSTRYLDVLNPGLVRVHRVTRDGNDLGIPLGKLWDQLGYLSQLSGANWSEVSRVGEQHTPATNRNKVTKDLH